MQTATELRAISKSKQTISLADHWGKRVQAHEKVVTDYLDKMCAALEN
jgi:hypothetical protein